MLQFLHQLLTDLGLRHRFLTDPGEALAEAGLDDGLDGSELADACDTIAADTAGTPTSEAVGGGR